MYQIPDTINRQESDTDTYTENTLFPLEREKGQSMKETRNENEKIDFKKYGQDAEKAWIQYEHTGNTDQLANVIRDRLEKMQPELIRTLFVYGLVFAKKTR